MLRCLASASAPPRISAAVCRSRTVKSLIRDGILRSSGLLASRGIPFGASLIDRARAIRRSGRSPGDDAPLRCRPRVGYLYAKLTGGPSVAPLMGSDSLHELTSSAFDRDPQL